MSFPRRLALFVVLLGLLGYQVWQNPPRPWTWMQTLGVCLFVPGILLWFTAHVQLGASFSISAQARALVTHGLYRRIRNPIYVFSLLVIAGVILFWRRPVFLFVLVLIIPIQLIRARKEARVLEEKFGEEYRAYRRQTWF